MDGFLVIDKPAGITSHDVVSFLRRKFQMKRVGHAGTLDPLATGVLIIFLGKSTQLFEKFSSFDKAYEATLRLGLRTSTADIEGRVISQRPYGAVTSNQVEEIFTRFVGDIEQIPPMVSAIKVGGKPLYKLARRGIEVKREPRRIKIYSLSLVDFALPDVKFCLECSKGTYVRKLAEDVGDIIGCGACITQIRRTKIGPFKIEEAVNLEEVNESHLRHWSY
ncbi:MAG: tRNA pseudouridine(55) synthase TruB [Candidatus Omnitrophota bacterium]